MNYKIVCECAFVSDLAAVEKLEEKVNEEIEQGWKPIGGITLHNATACQAMIKEDDTICRDL